MPTGREAVAWAREVESLGAGEIVLTSMDADGTKNGYDLEMTRAVVDAVAIPVVASGGAGNPEHLRAVLADAGAAAALAASIFHYRQYSIGETKDYLASRGVPVRRVARGSRQCTPSTGARRSSPSQTDLPPSESRRTIEHRCDQFGPLIECVRDQSVDSELHWLSPSPCNVQNSRSASPWRRPSKHPSKPCPTSRKRTSSSGWS